MRRIDSLWRWPWWVTLCWIASCGVTSAPIATRSVSQDLAVVRQDMVFVPGGPFLMTLRDAFGAELYLSRHTLDDFYIDREEVTVAEYAACVESGACTPARLDDDDRASCNLDAPGREDHPINCVTWEQARVFCLRAGKRLPTEAEWEKAARGADGRAFPWGDVPPTCAHAIMNDQDQCVHQQTAAVGQRPAGASPYGALDMAGNVWEWTALDAPDHDEARRAFRGGGHGMRPDDMRVTSRHFTSPSLSGVALGFRCARE